MSQHRFVRHRWDHPGRTTHGSNNLWINFSIQTYESVFGVLSSGMFWLQMDRDSLWCPCEGEGRGNWRVWGSSMVRWVDSYSIAHISLLQVWLVSDIVKGRAVAIQGLWNCTHLCLKDLFWLLIFLLSPTVCSVLILILGPDGNSNIPLEPISPNTVVLTLVSTLWMGKI